jgi:hypothetical protein
MFEFFDTCIFCNSQLPKSRVGEGEHIFPKSVYGFWRTYDVCAKCREAFCNEVDSLAIREIAILNAIESLRLKDTGPLLDNLTWRGEDTIDKRRIAMVKRGPNFRVKVNKADDFLECSERDSDKIVKPRLRELTRGKLSDEEFERQYLLLRQACLSLAPGETLHSEVFGCSIRRGQTTDFRVQNSKPSAITRLIAKIVTCFIHYAFPANKLECIEELQMLRDHARHGVALKQFTVNRLRPSEDGKYYRFHRVDVYPDGRIALIDTTFFGSIAWRTLLHSTEALVIKDDDGRLAEEMLLLLDFSNLDNRRKYAGFKYANEDEIGWREVKG